MGFAARFPGSCPQCGDDIAKGEMIEYNDDGDVQHVLCPEESTASGVPYPVCPRCFMSFNPRLRRCPECFGE